MASWYDDLPNTDIDDQTRRILKAKDREKNKKKLFLLVSMLVCILSSLTFFYVGILNGDAFGLIWTAIIGGFLGASINFLVNE